MNILPKDDPMFSYPQNIQDLIYLLAVIIEEKRRMALDKDTSRSLINPLTSKDKGGQNEK